MNLSQVFLLLDTADGVAIALTRFATAEEEVRLIGITGIKLFMGGNVDNLIFAFALFAFKGGCS